MAVAKVNPALTPITQPQGDPLLGTVGSIVGGAAGTALGGPLGGQAGAMLGGQIGGTGTVDAAALGQGMLNKNKDKLTQGLIGMFSEGGSVEDAFRRSQQRAMRPRWDSVNRTNPYGKQLGLYNDFKDAWSSAKDHDSVMKALNAKRAYVESFGHDSSPVYHTDQEGIKRQLADHEKRQKIIDEAEALQADIDANPTERVRRASPRSLGGVDWDIPLGSIGDVDFSTQGQYGMVKGADDPYAVQLTGTYNWGGDDTPMADRRAGEMSMGDYRSSGPEAAAADAAVESMGLSDKEKRLMAMFNSDGGQVHGPLYRATGGMTAPQDNLDDVIISGIKKAADWFSSRGGKIPNKGGPGPKRPKPQPQHKAQGGMMPEDTVKNGKFMSSHAPNFSEKVGPLAKTSYKSSGGEVWERQYHNPMMAKPSNK